LVVVPRELDDEDQRVLARMGLRSTVVAVVYPESMLEAADVSAVVDAWLFVAGTRILFSETVALARSGYTAIPRSLSGLSALDQQRRAILAELSDCEHDLLRAAAFGRTNREIAERLQTSEHYATYLLRRLLRRLKLRNRTEAAVFAARNLALTGGSEGGRKGLINAPSRH
jgi:DNA-binding NarL/FixJ family response regulator